MTLTQHTCLARLSDGEWRSGRELGFPWSVIASLQTRGLVMGENGGCYGIADERWTITPEGLQALESAG